MWHSSLIDQFQRTHGAMITPCVHWALKKYMYVYQFVVFCPHRWNRYLRDLCPVNLNWEGLDTLIMTTCFDWKYVVSVISSPPTTQLRTIPKIYRRNRHCHTHQYRCYLGWSKTRSECGKLLHNDKFGTAWPVKSYMELNGQLLVNTKWRPWMNIEE